MKYMFYILLCKEVLCPGLAIYSVFATVVKELVLVQK